MKIVLVNPPSPPEHRVSRGLMGGFGMVVNPGLLYPPIELAHVASVLEERGHEVSIHDSDALGLGAEGALEAVCAARPSLVLLDSSSVSLGLDLALAGRIRERTGGPVGVLGSHVTFRPDEILEGDPVDFVVRGEPEYTAREAADRLAAGRGVDGVAGISWRRGDGEVVHEEERAKIRDLDALPLPARHLLDNRMYRSPGVKGPITTVKSSRGCPLGCTYCGYVLSQGSQFRYRSAEHVLAELEDLYHRHGLRHVVFRDAIFAVRASRVKAICEGIIERGLELEWQCETAVRVLDREVLEPMARSGCSHISFGVESGNATIQKKYCGGKLLDHEQAIRVFDTCRELGIESRAFCMIGFPEETPEMIEETMRLVERLDPDQVQYCAVTAYPGTPLYEAVCETTEFDSAVMSGYRALEGNEFMSAGEIEARIRKAYRSFYLRPKRIVHELCHPRRFLDKVTRYLTLSR